MDRFGLTEVHDGVKIIPLAEVAEKLFMKKTLQTYFFSYGGHRSIAEIQGYRLAFLQSC